MTLAAIIESVLFTADSPYSLDRLCELLPEHERADIKISLTELAGFYEERQGGMYLAKIAGGWQFRTRPELQQYVVRHVKAKSVKFSSSALETLAIVAYRQPVTDRKSVV